MDYYLKAFCIFHFSLQSSVMSENGSCNLSGECCYGFEFLNGECVECSIGWFGFNCTSPCPDGYFGKLCGFQCECQHDQICDRELGCVNISTINTDIGTSTEQTLMDHIFEIQFLLIVGILGFVFLCLVIVFGIVYFMYKKRKNNMNTVAIESVQDVQGLDMDLQDMHGSISANANQFVYESVYEENRECNEEGEDDECSNVYNVSSYSKDKARRVGVNHADGLYDTTGCVAAHVNRQMNTEQQVEGPYCLAKNVAPDHNTESD